MSYCQFCGTKLEEGQTCTCEMAQAAAHQPSIQPLQDDQPMAQQTPMQSTSVAPSQVTTILKGLKSYLSAYVVNPVQAVRSEIEANSLTLSVSLSIVRLLVMGLAIYGLLRKICENAFSLISTSLLNYSDRTNIVSAGITAPLAQCLINGALIAAVGMLLFLTMTFILVKIRHGDITFTKVFKAGAANGVLTSALLLLSFVCSFFSVKFCVVFMALAMLSWIICGVLTVCVVSPDSHSGALWLMYFVGVVLIIVVGYYAVPPLFLRAVGGITASYAGQTVTLQTFIDTMAMELNSTLAEEGASSLGELLSIGIKEDVFRELVSDFWYSFF